MQTYMGVRREKGRLEKLCSVSFLSIGLLCASGMALAESGASSSPQELLHNFEAGFQSLDTKAQASLFAPDATFFGSTMPDLLRGPDGARMYFERAWATAQPGAMTCEPTLVKQPVPNVAIFATTCHLVRPDKTFTLRASGTAIQVDGQWRFAELHVSAPPAQR